MLIKHVQQRHARGCSAAVLAMVTGRDYDVIRSILSPKDWNLHGVYLQDLDDFLADSGFAVARKKRFEGYRHERRERRPWPCEPFADVHIAEVYVTGSTTCSHFVVLLSDGTVLDPLTDQPKRLTDYYDVLNIAGVQQIDGDAMRELCDEFEPLLIEVEAVRFERQQRINAECDAQQKWADSQAPSNNRWAFMTEFRARLERETEPLEEAVRRANRAFDRARR